MVYIADMQRWLDRKGDEKQHMEDHQCSTLPAGEERKWLLLPCRSVCVCRGGRTPPSDDVAELHQMQIALGAATVHWST
jgi:hypothetical protein